MKAIAVSPKKKSVDLINVPEPEISGTNKVKLEIIETGICGTDREICRFEYGTPPDGSDYLIIGHETLGRVVEIGSGVKNFRVGDLAVPTVRRGCPQNCVSCANDESDMCFTGDFKERGIKELHGFMSQRIVEEESNLVKMPQELLPFGVLLEPLTITEKALIQLDSIQRRLRWECAVMGGKTHYGCRKALVLGAGPVGILSALAFANRGFHTWVYSRIHEGSPVPKILEKAGIKMISSTDYDAKRLVSKMGEFDLILEATGASQMAFEMLETLGTNGIYFLTGVPGRKHPFNFNGAEAMRNLVLKNQVLIGTVNASRKAFENGIVDLMGFEKKFAGVAPSLITNRVTVENVIPFLQERKKGEIKTVLTF